MNVAMNMLWIKFVEPELVEPELVEPELVEPELVEPELVESAARRGRVWGGV